MTIREMSARLGGLVVFRGILQDALVQRFQALLQAVLAYDGDPAPLAAAAGAFEAELLPRGEDWSAVLLDILLQDDNLCIRKAASGGAGEVADACLARELALLQQAGSLTMDALLAGLPGPIPFCSRCCPARGKPPRRTMPPPTARAARRSGTRGSACSRGTMSLRWRTDA